MKQLKTCEQVTKFHPDKIADAIGDLLVDCLGSEFHHAVEVQIKGIVKDNVHIVYLNLAGEVTLVNELIMKKAISKVRKLVKKLIVCDKIKINNYLTLQSSQINSCAEEGFGDQGTYMAYAYNDPSTNYLPKEYYYACKTIEFIEKEYQSDSKCLVAYDYENDKIDSIKASICIKSEARYKEEVEEITNKIRNEFNVQNVFINEHTYWTFGSVFADCGVLGRKVACDNYGFLANGGVFYGKDISKSDRAIPFYLRLLLIDYCKKHKSVKSIRIDTSGMIGDTHLANYSIEAIDQNNNIVDLTDFVDVTKVEFVEIKNIVKKYKISSNRPFMTFGLK
jgi:S-adenosylmethionine synthetase